MADNLPGALLGMFEVTLLFSKDRRWVERRIEAGDFEAEEKQPGDKRHWRIYTVSVIEFAEMYQPGGSSSLPWDLLGYESPPSSTPSAQVGHMV